MLDDARKELVGVASCASKNAIRFLKLLRVHLKRNITMLQVYHNFCGQNCKMAKIKRPINTRIFCSKETRSWTECRIASASFGCGAARFPKINTKPGETHWKSANYCDNL